MYTLTEIDNISQCWGFKIKSLHPEIPVAGSPERTDYRIVVEDQSSSLYILEQIPAHLLEHKRMLDNILNFLYNKGFAAVEPYKRDIKGNTIIEYSNQYWQIVPLIQNVPLERPSYIFNAWRGVAMAQFLIDLKAKSAGIAAIVPETPFSLKNYVIDFMKKLQVNNPEIVPQLLEIYLYLEKSFFLRHDELEIIFCHGDYHPLNILWGYDCINRVIDWEFAGFKPFLYDVANMLGCLGMEEPRSLLGCISNLFLRKLINEDYLHESSLQYLPEFIIALRFAWLAEWLRKNDQQMIKLELIYMYLLLDHQEQILKNWRKLKLH